MSDVQKVKCETCNAEELTDSGQILSVLETPTRLLVLREYIPGLAHHHPGDCLNKAVAKWAQQTPPSNGKERKV